MFKEILDLYTRGDLDNLKQKILHTSSWKQHEFTAYGSSQIEKLWLENISQFGFGEIINHQEIKGDKHSALYLEIKKNDNETPVKLGLFFEHNDSHIKRVNCIVDTLSLRDQIQCSDQGLLNKLPEVDPLLISQFDHQLHPYSYHAQPSDLINLPDSIKETVNQWWHIWQANQMATFEQLYGLESEVVLPGETGQKGYQAIRKFRLVLNNKLNRSYCQLTAITFDESNNSVAALWEIDGDYVYNNNTIRVRVPVLSFLTIEDGKIIKECIQIDWYALMKRFNISKPIA